MGLFTRTPDTGDQAETTASADPQPATQAEQRVYPLPQDQQPDPVYGFDTPPDEVAPPEETSADPQPDGEQPQ